MPDLLSEILVRFPECRRVNHYSPGQLPYGTKNLVFYETTFGYITIKIWPALNGSFDMTLRIGNLHVKEWESKTKEILLDDLDECRSIVVQTLRNMLTMLGE